MRACRIVVAALAVALVGGCSSSGPAGVPNAADATFLQDMIPHHERALAVARIGLAHADDARVHAFAVRIIAEQTPELRRMKARVSAAHLSVDLAAGSQLATNRITDTQQSGLRRLHGAAFDKQFLALNITSEQGAAAMARTELTHGKDDEARTLAKAIAGAPTSEIPELQALLGQLS